MAGDSWETQAEAAVKDADTGVDQVVLLMAKGVLKMMAEGKTVSGELIGRTLEALARIRAQEKGGSMSVEDILAGMLGLTQEAAAKTVEAAKAGDDA